MKFSYLVFACVFAVSMNSHANEVSKEAWLEGMSTALPAAFCNSSMYFRQCFEISQEECEDMAASTTRICLKKYQDQLPKVLVQPQDGTRWGQAVGACAGEAFEVALIKKRINSDRCNNVDNWR